MPITTKELEQLFDAPIAESIVAPANFHQLVLNEK